jgi:flagellar hook-associated protein 3 FlgL
VTAFRVTERSIATNVLAGLQGNLNRLGDIQQRLSSGKEISKPADSPTGSVAAMQFRSEIATAKQYSRNAADSAAWLGVADSTLTTVTEKVQRVRELVLEGMSNGTGGSPEARQGLAAEVDQLQKGAIGLANTKYLDRPVFGGTTMGLNAYDDTGAYVGDGGVVQRTVGDNAKIDVALTGPTVFGTGTDQLFGILADISDSLRNDPSALEANLARLDTAAQGLKAAQATVGARYNQVTDMQQKADDKVIALKGQLSEVEDIDLPMVLTDLSLQQTAYQAALAAGSKVVQQSLIDFLR